MRKPTAYDNLLAHLEKLPGIGKRSAERIAFHLLRQPESDTLGLADAVRAFRENLKVCSVTGHVSESDPCSIVTDESRDHSTILVVEQPSDVIAMEQTGAYTGSYHVLMGRLAPMEAMGPGDLNIDKLLGRVEAGQAGTSPAITEVILGTNPTLEGDGTALYLAEKLQAMGVKVTRLARGLPTGSNLQNVSKAVLSDAVQGRVSEF
ncbi:recombination mediator RecR [Algisphaera agarilytica]|uniref:Recombination protein RecR n=1 Tax=Algisphaera agarilytica TaxID=1385975 RepID=A0A7X0H7Y6_9BACT|nr:recombination mediator RecR [Algisphaera agarilytica]MBB6430955.1 recombination protein RecR [Algisphaera agarilytica]